MARPQELTDFQRGWQEGAEWQRKRISELRKRAEAGSSMHRAQLDDLLEFADEEPES